MTVLLIILDIDGTLVKDLFHIPRNRSMIGSQTFRDELTALKVFPESIDALARLSKMGFCKWYAITGRDMTYAIATQRQLECLGFAGHITTYFYPQESFARYDPKEYTNWKCQIVKDIWEGNTKDRCDNTVLVSFDDIKSINDAFKCLAIPFAEHYLVDTSNQIGWWKYWNMHTRFQLEYHLHRASYDDTCSTGSQ